MNMRIAVFASGRGSNLLAIHDAVISGKLEGVSLNLAVCDRLDAPVVDLVHKRNIPDFIFCPKDYADKNAFETVIAEKLAEAKSAILIFISNKPPVYYRKQFDRSGKQVDLL